MVWRNSCRFSRLGDDGDRASRHFSHLAVGSLVYISGGWVSAHAPLYLRPARIWRCPQTTKKKTNKKLHVSQVQKKYYNFVYFLCCRHCIESVHAAGRWPGHVVLHRPHGVGAGRQGAPAVRPIAAEHPPGQAGHRPAHQGHQVQRLVHSKPLWSSIIFDFIRQKWRPGHVFYQECLAQ